VIRLRIRSWGFKALAVFLVIGLCLVVGQFSGHHPGYLVPEQMESPLVSPGTDWLNPLAWTAVIGGYALVGLVIRLPSRLRKARDLLKLPRPARVGRPRKKRWFRLRA